MKRFWDLLKYLGGRSQEKVAGQEGQGQRIQDQTCSREVDGLRQNRRYWEHDKVHDNELDWGPGDQAGDAGEGWGWDVWRLWW